MPFDLAYDASTIFLTGVGTTTYDYDANGYMTTRGNLTLVWDAENRLTNVLESGVNIATFTYDHAGMRVKKEDSSGTTVYVGGPALSLPNGYYEKNLTTGVETFYYYLGNRLVAYKHDGDLRYVFQAIRSASLRTGLGSTAL